MWSKSRCEFSCRKIIRKANYDVETDFLCLSTETLTFDSLTSVSKGIILDETGSPWVSFHASWRQKKSKLWSLNSSFISRHCDLDLWWFDPQINNECPWLGWSTCASLMQEDDNESDLKSRNKCVSEKTRQMDRWAS